MNKNYRNLIIKDFSQENIIGDGFYLSKKDFDAIRKKGKPIQYLEEEFEDYKKWKNKITKLYKKKM